MAEKNSRRNETTDALFDAILSLESREEVGEMLFAMIKTHFAALMASRYLALSFEIEELHPTLNYKQNNIHALFK